MRPLSIGLRWTLRYTAATMLVVSGLAFAYYKLVERQSRQDAYLLLELQVNEIVEAVEHATQGGWPGPELSAYIEQHVDSANRDLKLGIRVLDAEGHALFERGAFQARPIPVPSQLERLAQAGRTVETDVGDSFPYAINVVRVDPGYVEIGISTRRFLRGLRDLRNRFLATLPVALLVTGFVGWWLARGSLASIARMTDAARRISASQLHEEIPTSGTGDELDALAQTLNRMMERIRSGVARVRSFSANAAHQLRSPISRLHSRLEIAALADRDPEEDQILIESALRDVERLGEAIRGMLRLSESEGGVRPERRQAVDAARLLEEVVGFFEPVAAECGIALTLDTPTRPVVAGDADWLRELFSNLVDNALKYTPDGGHVRVAARTHGDGVTLTVQDDGPGIPGERLSRIFERLERGALADEAPGTGLGLAVAREIALAHDGRIQVTSAPGHGATFTVWLPLHRRAHAA